MAKNTDTNNIRFVSVGPFHSGQYIGKLLTQKGIDFAIESGEQTIALPTSEIMANARHIYETFGFEILYELKPRLCVRYWFNTLNINKASHRIS